VRKTVYTAVFAALFCLLFPACDNFNAPLKDFIKDATGRTKGLGYEILTAHYMRADGTAAIPPSDVMSEQTKINVFLSNKENYYLHITLTGEGSENAGFTLSDNRRTILVTLLNQPRAVDSIVYVFDLTLNMTANDRPMPSVKLPRMECRYLDDHLAGLSVSGIELSPPFRPDTTAYTVSLPYETPSITLSGILPHFGACLIQDARKNWTNDTSAFTHTIPVNDGVPSTVPVKVIADSGKIKDYALYMRWVFTSIDVLGTWLAAQPTNTPATAYPVALNVSDLGGDRDTSGSAGYALGANGSKYVVIDLLGSTITSIGEGAFAFCHGLTSLTIPDSVTTIGDDAFYGCINLTSVTIGNNVTTIGRQAFLICIGLTSVIIPDSVTTIGEAAFASCYGLTSLTIPNSVTTIGDWAFEGCWSFTSLTIPNSVTTIGEGAFGSCYDLTSVTFQGTITAGTFSQAFYGLGDLRAKFYATDPANGTPGTYTRPNTSSLTWTKK